MLKGMFLRMFLFPPKEMFKSMVKGTRRLILRLEVNGKVLDRPMRCVPPFPSYPVRLQVVSR